MEPPVSRLVFSSPLMYNCGLMFSLLEVFSTQ